MDPDEERLLKAFKDLGIEVDTSLDVMFMKIPLIGSEGFINEWIESKLGILSDTLDVLGKLPNPHVAYYLLKQAAGVCKVLFWMRTMPGCMAGFVRPF